MRLFRSAFAIAVAVTATVLFVIGPDMSAPSADPPKTARADGPVVVELFTSQSCSSCPPAEAFFRDLARRPDLLTLEWHIDYWDNFKDPRGGVYKDPFSSRAHTARQILYNQRLRGVTDVYTPQAVVGGIEEETGTDQSAIKKAISKQASGSAPGIRVVATKGGTISFALEGVPADAELMLVTFQKQAVTKITKGENHGKQLGSANVVTGFKQLKPMTNFQTPFPAEGAGCALLVHAKGQGPILAAAYCP
jgi:hypothetical protein